MEGGRGIQIVCSACGFRQRRYVADLIYRGDMAHKNDRLPAFTRDMCANCDANAGFCPSGWGWRRMFVDFEREPVLT